MTIPRASRAMSSHSERAPDSLQQASKTDDGSRLAASMFVLA